MHVLGTGVPRRLAVARCASSPKAAQTLECSQQKKVTAMSFLEGLIQAKPPLKPFW